MLSLSEFIRRFALDYTVQHIDDVESGVFVTEINKDIYLMSNQEVKE